jgi:feruloyl esterase
MTVKSKDLIKTFYGSPARLSYFNGCSTGGRQALMEAQRFPEDYDGIVAGAPANNHIHLHVAGTARSIDIINIPGDHALTRAKQDNLAKAVMAACDELDGVKDGLITNPRKCTYDPQLLLCKGADSDTCLTAPQIAAVKRTYADTITKKGEIVWTGFERGTEAGLGVIGTNTAPGGGLDSIKILGYQDPNWDWHQFDLDRDLKVTVDRAPSINADSTDLSKFKAHGGKLILYHGWTDPSIPPGNTVNYYNGVLNEMGKDQENWMRLFMMPGMNHCGGGAGPNQFSYIATLERWRESNQAPEQLLGFHVTNNRVDMSRPVCKYPQVATYTGTGSTNDAANFVCK